VQAGPMPLTVDDAALLDKIASAVVDRRMESPALLFLESASPLNFIGSQALHVLLPILECVCDARDLERAAHLLERRDILSRLMALIEAKANERSAGTVASRASATEAADADPGRTRPR
ncbi:MAG: hypothetical protein ACREI3_00225, partial [Nitrospirales bacterium]